MTKFKLGELFSGAGGLGLGAVQAQLSTPRAGDGEPEIVRSASDVLQICKSLYFGGIEDFGGCYRQSAERLYLTVGLTLSAQPAPLSDGHIFQYKKGTN